jgi:hypothetical protein
MGHSINGFIARHDALIAAARDLPKARVCRLVEGFGFVPLTQDVASWDDPAAEYEYLDRLTAAMAAWAVEQSRRFPIAYVQTDYHGGTGSQCAVVWRDGVVSFGPVETVDTYEKATPLLDGAINRAVRFLGVERGHARVEFEALGLNLYRDNEDWVEAAGGSAA